MKSIHLLYHYFQMEYLAAFCETIYSFSLHDLQETFLDFQAHIQETYFMNPSTKNTAALSPVKIIFFDIDGTMIALGQKKMSSVMRDTLLKQQENGVKICISTSRAPVFLPEFEGVQFDAFVTLNGSYCYGKDGVILSNPPPKEEVRQYKHLREYPVL